MLIPGAVEKRQELEREAVALVRRYGAMLGFVPGLKDFLRRLADDLGWQNLKKEL